MNKKLLLSCLLAMFCLGASSALASDNIGRSLRYQAESNYRIAKKAYISTMDSYGDNLESMPQQEKDSVCTKIRRGLHDNRTQIIREDIWNQKRFEKYSDELESYSGTIGCQ
ncbi:hypothetical protein [Pseudodesulfovibrio profundus]|uniref:hypothetical protein n=1 Tax=Pseudodesulfovibrio profundus TaxID=57320 RepID=UPI000BE287A0|nr:hypothetical protein [Pseudodesulfovibrio profundus]